MVRWIDGFYGGLLAGVTSAAFSAGVSALWLHETTAGELFAQIARGVAPFRGAPVSWALAGLGAVLYLILAVGFGIAYALLARRMRSMWRAPGSVMWGLAYGLLVWWLVNDVFVPVAGVVATQPAWEGLVGTVVFYGVVLSEATTLARRRAAATTAAG
jgi:hypothetical protein